MEAVTSGYPLRRWSGARRASMQDLVFVGITIVFFAVSIGYVHFCERIR
jgi:hypothetical protein